MAHGKPPRKGGLAVSQMLYDRSLAEQWLADGGKQAVIRKVVELQGQHRLPFVGDPPSTLRSRH